MKEYYWVKSKGVVEQVSEPVFYYLRDKNIAAKTTGDHHMLIKKTRGHLNIMKVGFIPDIPIKALREILSGQVRKK